jgi:hypothetical protein
VRTDDLVSMLATGAGAVDAKSPTRRLLLALGGGALIATLLMGAWLHVNPELASYALMPMFWVRELFCAALAIGGLTAVLRCSRPGATLRWERSLLVAPVLALWLLAAAVLVNADAAERTDLLRGISWTVCSANIALLSLPIFAALVWLMKGLAPTRLRLSGAAAGVAAGAVGALVYTVHCPELAAPFLALWYVLGMLLPAALGAWVGPRLLRW